MRQRRTRATAFAALMLVTIMSCSNSPQRTTFPFRKAADAPHTDAGESTNMPKPNLPTSRVRAPEFPSEFAWVNTDRPLRFKEELRGSVVVLDFWTYCCINCMHILPDLEYIEHKYAGKPVVIIGVHSAKFDNESDHKNILSAVHRYDIAHPVIVDQDHEIWSAYGVNSWPTLMVIDSEGKVVGALSGEGNREVLDGVIAALLEEESEKGTLAAAPPEFRRDSRVPSLSGLAFPGKIHAKGDRVFIADSNHDRIVVADSSGNVLGIVGSGKKGQRNGTFSEAEFDNPQGMVWDEAANLLYVADTDNHLIRKIDLAKQTVETICGTGEQIYDRTGGGLGRAQGLNSPWDLALQGNTLYIAMAGPHQLWTLDLKTMLAKAWAGSGQENIIDGVGTRSAALAQPSGLALSGNKLYFADSEVSAVRCANTETSEVTTLIGSGLFDFGDQTGHFRASILQHPLGVAVQNEILYVADTYNHKVKKLDLIQKQSSDFAGSGNPNLGEESETSLSLYEPGGLCVNGETLYIADTNHDRIIKVDTDTRTWSVFELKGLRASETQIMEESQFRSVEVGFRKGSDLKLILNPQLPKGTHLNADAPLAYAVTDGNGMKMEQVIEKGKLPVEVTLPASSLRNSEQLTVALFLAYCTENDRSLCVPVTVGWKLTLIEKDASLERVELTADVK